MNNFDCNCMYLCVHNTHKLTQNEVRQKYYKGGFFNLLNNYVGMRKKLTTKNKMVDSVLMMDVFRATPATCLSNLV